MHISHRLLLRVRTYFRELNTIGNSVAIGKDAFIKGSKITGKVSLGEGCRIYYAQLRGNITLGRYTSVWGPYTDLQTSIHRIVIGNFCSIARHVTFQEYNHDISRFTTYFIEQNLLGNAKALEVVSKGDIELGHDVWIGAHCVILSGVKIGTGSVIAANSVVTENIPPYSIAGGVPAKVIKPRFNEEVVAKLLQSEWWNWSVERLKKDRGILDEMVKLK
jgi:virginiamycin A acetyltransferase